MASQIYRKGRDKEYKVCRKYRKLKYDLVQRTAGSHSSVDVIAIDGDMKVIKLIQVKPNSMSEKEKEAIKWGNRKLNGVFHVEFLIE